MFFPKEWVICSTGTRLNNLGHVMLVSMCTELCILWIQGDLNRINRKCRGKISWCKVFYEDVIQEACENSYERWYRVRPEVSPSPGFLSQMMTQTRALQKSLDPQKPDRKETASTRILLVWRNERGKRVPWFFAELFVSRAFSSI